MVVYLAVSTQYYTNVTDTQPDRHLTTAWVGLIKVYNIASEELAIYILWSYVHHASKR